MIRRLMRRNLTVAAAVVAWVGASVACTQDAPAPPEQAPEVEVYRPPPPPAIEVFERWEGRMLGSASRSIDFEVTASGAMTADFTGQLSVGANGHGQLGASGRINGRPFDVVLESEGGRLEYGDLEEPREANVPPDLTSALVTAFVRMGVFHDVVRLADDQLPERAGGGVDRWVSVADVRYADDNVIALAVTVAGRAYATASLTLDEDGVPLMRSQTVALPQGEVRVEERYSGFTDGR